MSKYIKKCNLEDGDIVKIRSGRRFVYDKESDMIQDDYINTICMKDYDDYLYHLFDEELDIVEVYKRTISTPGRFDKLKSSINEISKYRLLRIYTSKEMDSYQPVAEFDNEKDAIMSVCDHNNSLKEGSCYYYAYQKVSFYTNRSEL